ncbi:hypothetical protein JW964_12415, partial [candidate division KSB1 bacterium]|nr:hypothetical protein [candidate division KSB1 bacterium]
MNGITPFTISTKDLTILSPERAVIFFRRLLWAEASKVGIGKYLINCPDCINVADGGIDAHVINASPQSDNMIPIGTSGFQIKASDLSPCKCKKELHQGENLKNPLKSEIVRILENQGTYVLVLFAEITPQQITDRKNAISEELKQYGYNNSIRIYTANIIQGFAEQFISIKTWFKADSNQCLSFDKWGEYSDINQPKKFVLNPNRSQVIEGIKTKLRNPDNKCPVFRIVGLPGIGKTRIVYEALNDYDLKSRVVYLKADQFYNSSLFFTLQNDENISAILVIDECDSKFHDQFVRSFSERGSRLALITISTQEDKIPEPTLVFRLDRLNGKQIEKIISLEQPQLPGNIISRISDFADGYPRIALLLLSSYLLTGDSINEFLEFNDDLLMNRLIGGQTDQNSDYFKKIRKTLTGLSLFSKVGYGGEFFKESKWIADKFRISLDDFREIVQEQKNRRIVQGNYYIYVTPFMLRVHLLREWWEKEGFNKDTFNDFIESIPEEFRIDLINRFIEHIPFIPDTKNGKSFIKDVLSRNGIFSDYQFLNTRIGSDFFLKLSKAD